MRRFLTDSITARLLIKHIEEEHGELSKARSQQVCRNLGKLESQMNITHNAIAYRELKSVFNTARSNIQPPLPVRYSFNQSSFNSL